MSNQAARAELGGFLRMRREAVDRSAHDLPPIRGRKIDLRREEVAFLSAISVTWYTWLEQGRDINPGPSSTAPRKSTWSSTSAPSSPATYGW